MIRSLKSKLILVVSSFIFLFGIFAMVFGFYYVKGVLLDISVKNVKDITYERSHETARILENVLKFSDLLASRKESEEYLVNPEEFGHNNMLDFIDLYNIEESFLAIYIMDKHGNVLVSTDSRFTGNNYGFRSYYKKAMEGESNLDIVLGVTSKQLGYYFATPVKNKNNETLGVIIIKMNPNAVDESMHATLHESGSTMLLDDHGVIIYSNSKDRLYSSIGKLTEEDLFSIKEGHRFDGVDIKELAYQEVKDVLDSFEETSAFNIYNKKEKKEEIVSLAQIGDFPLFLFIEEDSAIYINPARNIAYILSSVIILAILFSILGILWFIGKLLKPLNLLKEASQDIAKGNLKVRVNINTGDELEDLGISFNKMAIKLQKNIEDIEKKIAERTVNLEKLNRSMIGRELKMIKLKKEIINLKAKQKNKLNK